MNHLPPHTIRDMAEASIRKALVGPVTPKREALFAEFRAMPDEWFAANRECLGNPGKWVAAFTDSRAA